MSDREAAIKNARRKGLLDGAASIFYLFAERRPAPPRVRRTQGSLGADMRELRRDSDRLISARR